MEFPEDMKREPYGWGQGMKISYLGIALAVALGVVAGQVTVKIGEHYWIAYQLKVAAEELEATTARLNAEAAIKREQRLKAQAEASKIRAKQENDRRNAKRTNIEVCNFWIEQYKEESTSFNKNMMNSACARAKASN
ncbi:MAG: hypothetical protein OQK94_11695 [Gammaproteobacteria bacterium]|nr:hypothetical protein [Gammaproteobacteria bacterium]MCW8839967.1 hypothetical protein [Gammaproteobacteria bacterium]MCW8959332.1 hypothetical protein [Gammaproteobacteria bacterium]MCW8993779.1 hypothetical protein [Gammaproteobacteria bacterium]